MPNPNQPYHQGCPLRYEEKKDHELLMRRFNDLADKVHKLTQVTHDLQQEIVDYIGHNSVIDELRAQLSTLNNKIATLNGSITRQFQDLEREVNNTIQGLDDTVESCNTKIAALTERVNAVQQIITDIGYDPEDGSSFKEISVDEMNTMCDELFVDDY